MAAFLRLNFIRRPLLKLRNHPSSGFSVLRSFNGTKNPHQETAAYKAKENSFSQIVQAISSGSDPTLKDALHHWKEMLKYTWYDFKNNHETTLVYQCLNEHRTITKQQLSSAQTMEMIFQVLYVNLYICDDILDNTSIRFGKPSWPCKKGIGIAMIDTIVNQEIVYKLLNIHFRDEPYYINVVELLHEVMLKLYLGESLQALCEGNKKSINFEMYTLSNYAAIAEYKTAYIIYVLPFAAALYMSEIYDAKTHAKVRELAKVLGHYCQVTDDFIDCFGNPVKTGKLCLGADIREGKFTWLLANALKLADQRQLQVLKDNYGSEEPRRVQRIMDLYRDLDLPTVLANYQNDVYNSLEQASKKQSTHLPNSIYKTALHLINIIKSGAQQ